MPAVDWFTRATGLGREIVAKRVGILAALGIVLGLLVQLQIIPIDWSTTVTAWVTAVITAVTALVSIQWTRSGVTPADPRLAPTASDGTPLIPASLLRTPDLLARELDDRTPATHDAKE